MIVYPRQSRRLCGRAGWSIASSLPSDVDVFGRGSHDGGEAIKDVAAWLRFAAFESAEALSRDTEGRRHLGLGETGLNAKVGQGPFGLRDRDDVANGDAKHIHDASQRVHGRGTSPLFPGRKRGQADPRQAREIALAHLPAAARSD